MDISTVIVTFNASAFIGACLRSVGEQLRGLEYELILVDNASEDGTCDLIEREFPEVDLIRNPSNQGFARANNLALEKATGDFVLLLNPDTVWSRGNLKEAVGWMKDHPGVGAMGCRLVFGDGSWQKSYGNFPTLWSEFREALFLPRLFPGWRRLAGTYGNEDSPDLKPVDWVSCTFFLCRRELMAQVGFLDEQYFLYYEDIDLSKRIREKGKAVFYYPRIEVVHHQRTPPVIDFGESPYLYFSKFMGRDVARRLRTILMLKTLVRIAVLTPVALFSGKKMLLEKLRSQCRTFRFHLTEAPRVLRGLSTASVK